MRVKLAKSNIYMSPAVLKLATISGIDRIYHSDHVLPYNQSLDAIKANYNQAKRRLTNGEIAWCKRLLQSPSLKGSIGHISMAYYCMSCVQALTIRFTEHSYTPQYSNFSFDRQLKEQSSLLIYYIVTCITLSAIQALNIATFLSVI